LLIELCEADAEFLLSAACPSVRLFQRQDVRVGRLCNSVHRQARRKPRRSSSERALVLQQRKAPIASRLFRWLRGGDSIDVPRVFHGSPRAARRVKGMNGSERRDTICRMSSEARRARAASRRARMTVEVVTLGQPKGSPYADLTPEERLAAAVRLIEHHQALRGESSPVPRSAWPGETFRRR
jgi:hypothetical protein